MPTIRTPATARLLGQTVNVRFSASSTWGCYPATLTLVAPFQAFDNVQGHVSDLTIQCAGVTLTWRDVRIASVESATPGDTGLWRVTLEDRRWRWEFGHLDGDYNAPRANGGLLRQRTPRQLAALLFQAMGEENFDVGQLPNTGRPRAAWRQANARTELEKLCGEIGCAVAFDGPGDSARIVRVGIGPQPINPEEYGGKIAGTRGRGIPARPSQIRVVGGPVLWQDEWVFSEAVGEDVDGQIRPINELSYAPADGWSARFAESSWGGPGTSEDFAWLHGSYTANGETLYVRDLALKSVFRWYRAIGVRSQVIFQGGVPILFTGARYAPAQLQGGEFADIRPASLDDIEFFNNRVERDSASGQRLPIKVDAEWFRSDRMGLNNTLGPYNGTATVNPQTRCLVFDQPFYRIDQDDDSSTFFKNPGVATVTCAFICSRDGIPVRYDRFLDNSGPSLGARERCEHHDEIVREVVNARAANGVAFVASDNLAEVDAAANFYLQAIAAEYVIRDTAQIELPLIHHFAPDGQLRSVKWEGSSESASTTHLSYNAEPSSLHPDYRDTPRQRARREAEAAAREREAKQKLQGV